MRRGLLSRLTVCAVEDPAVERITQLTGLDDRPGDQVAFTGAGLELGRDSAFVYIDGQVCTGVAHPSIIGDYCRANGFTEAETLRVMRLRFSGRPWPGHGLAMGHLSGDVAVIEASSVTGVDIGEVVAALQAGGARKVYVGTSFDADHLDRLAGVVDRGHLR